MRFGRPHSERLALGAAFSLLLLAIAAFLLMRPSAQASEQPEFLLPWQHGQSWLTGAAGFHNANDAIDFFPPDTPLSIGIKCEGDPDWVLEVSSYYILSSAAGVVVQASDASVLIDHGGGWRSRHYHMTEFVVEVGDYVTAGQRLARPSTLGFCSSGPHNHFWIEGPSGETTADVTLSGIPATEIGTDTYYSATSNFEPVAGGASPPPAPTATPGGPLRGDANCDGGVNANDATTVLWIITGRTDPECGVVTADTDCDGLITVQDALNILRHVPALAVLPAAACPTPAPTPTMIPDDTPTPTAPGG
ncbi:MAG: peptidoglycan DD-metalloendopeptidase family protein [Chloroflexi bacterium]|nr:peptidoglycan DD-metalloendopeptidase family protein [Chloroflexota bacterium]